MVDDPNRDAKGKFVPGNNANPNGEHGHMKGYQPYGKRAQFWLDQLSAEGLLTLYKDKKEFGKLSVYDGMIITHLVDTYFAKDRGSERERLIDRMEGKSKSTVDLNMDGKLNVTHTSDADTVRLLVSRIAGIRERLGLTGRGNPPVNDAGGTDQTPK